jgi:molybdate transport system substrate-binding protein
MMKAGRLGLLVTLLMAATADAQPSKRDEQQITIRVLCTQTLRTSLLELAPRFEQRSGMKVELSIAPSGRLVARVRDGEGADVLIANAPNIDSLIKEGRIAGVRVDLARAEVGLVVRAGVAKPDISSAEAVKRVLLDAKAVAYSPGGLSGAIFETALDKLGIAPVVKAKAKLGSPAAAFVARGEADIAAQQISELIAVQGVELVGPLPAELGGATQFSIGTLATAPQADLAKRFVEFLKSDEAARVITAKGLTPG